MSRLQHTYMRLCLTWSSRYQNGDAASRADYVAENTAFYNTLVANNVYVVEGNPITNFNVNMTYPPNQWTLK